MDIGKALHLSPGSRITHFRFQRLPELKKSHIKTDQIGKGHGRKKEWRIGSVGEKTVELVAKI
jgi:hypothetical protein